eukprot:GHVS01015137.1.p1 GENE.GHVS01015137.1~~GHVS01015137.1.p1  ORF type:complete len:121 (-),score=3.62 GHVS01015137.1:678-1040(-)
MTCVRAKVVGHVCSHEGVSADPSKVEALSKMRNPNHAKVAAPLTALMRNDAVLRMVKSGRSFILETDASDIGAGAVLKQEQDGTEEVLEFASAKFSPTRGRSRSKNGPLLVTMDGLGNAS